LNTQTSSSDPDTELEVYPEMVLVQPLATHPRLQSLTLPTQHPRQTTPTTTHQLEKLFIPWLPEARNRKEPDRRKKAQRNQSPTVQTCTLLGFKGSQDGSRQTASSPERDAVACVARAKAPVWISSTASVKVVVNEALVLPDAC
jgi:hypothetical protein